MAIRLGRVQLSRRAAWIVPAACALAAAAVLWRKPVSRLRARAVRDAMVFTGLDPMTMALLQRLARTWRPNRIIVIEPDDSHPLLGEARAAGARVMIGDPASPRVLRPVLAGWRGCALSYLYALRPDAGENEAVLAAAHTVLRRCRPDPERQPHLIARIDDVRHADCWRGWRCGTPGHWFEDALSAPEATACALVNEIFRAGARQLLLCGDSTLALAILLELARRYGERRDLAGAAALGRAAHPDAAQPAGAGQPWPAPLPLEQVLLVGRRAEDLRREYLATSPHLVAGAHPDGSAHPDDRAYPGVAAQPVPWQEHLLAMLDGMPADDAAATAVVIADSLPGDGMHEAGRVARLHPAVPVFALTSDGAGPSDAIFGQLRPIQHTLLVDGEAPEDTWTRVARHWHECCRLSHPPVPGDPRKLTGRPWEELDDFIRQDKILQLRSLMTAVVARGRRWAPRRAVAPGSFIELNDHDLEEVARAEHTRRYRRRVRAGWTAVSDSGGGPFSARVNARVRPWEDLPPEIRASNISHVRSQLAQLESVGFMPVVPEGGPPGAAPFERVGVVRARQLRARRRWTRRSGDELRGDPGDWRVTDGDDERTVRDLQFRASHEPLGGEHWRRTGTYSAWQVREKLVLRTMEGRATAEAGDWVVEGHQGERWPVTDEQFRKTYRMKQDEQV